MKPTIRIVATEDDPYATACFPKYPSRLCKKPGLETEFIHTVINGMMGYPTEWIMVDSYDEMDEHLDDGRADVLGISYIYDEYYNELPGWDASTEYIWDGFALIAKEQITDNNADQFILFRVFSWQIWATTLGISLLLVLLMNVNNYPLFKGRHISLSFVEAFWYITAVVILSTYTNLVAITLVTPLRTRSIPFNSLNETADLILSKQCRFAVPLAYKDDLEFHGNIINPIHNFSFAQKLRDAYQANPPLYVDSRDDMGKLVEGSTYKDGNCYIGMDYLTMDSYYKSRFCDIRLTIFPDDLPLYGYVFYMNASVGLLPEIDGIIKSDALIGYVSYLEKKYYAIPYPPGCPDIGEWQPLELIKISDIFILLLVVCAVGILLLCFETFFHAWNSGQLRKKSMPVLTLAPPRAEIYNKTARHPFFSEKLVREPFFSRKLFTELDIRSKIPLDALHLAPGFFFGKWPKEKKKLNNPFGLKV